jgi:hypothetical protein
VYPNTTLNCNINKDIITYIFTAYDGINKYTATVTYNADSKYILTTDTQKMNITADTFVTVTAHLKTYDVIFK